jgi:hypothetical protein
MRWLVAAWLVLALVLGSSSALADSYSYGGAGRRFELEVFLLGFHEGAGAGGWDEDSAREFAVWASRFDAVIPKGAFVSLVKDVGDSDTTLTIRVGRRVETRELAGEPDLDAALTLVARRFRVAVPVARPAKLYTLQLFASRSQPNALRFVERIEAQGVTAERQVYHAACHPCWIRQSRLLEPTKDGMHRVVTGVYAERWAAERGLRGIARRWKLRGFVRELR